MAQRDTFLPVCKLIQLGVNSDVDVDIARTAVFVSDVSMTDPSGFQLGKTSLNISGAPADTLTSATINVVVSKTGSFGSPNVTSVEISEKGAFDSSISDLGVSGMGSNEAWLLTELGAGVGVSGVFVVNKSTTVAPVTYITVTDLSGASGFFRVSPTSSANLYASGTTAHINQGATNASGAAGTVAGYGSTAILTLQPGHGIDRIHIENQLDTASLFAVNYGIIKQANPLRDQSYPEVL